MIVLDDLDEQELKDSVPDRPTVRLPERAVGRASSVILPDYETSQAEAWQPLSSTSEISLIKHPSRRPQFWRRFAIALAVYTILSVLIGVPLIVRKLMSNKYNNQPLPSLTHVEWDDDSFEYPDDSPNTDIVDVEYTPICDYWDHVAVDQSLHKLTASRVFSVDSQGSLTIRCNATGDVMYGTFTIDVNPDATYKDSILYVQAISPNSYLRERTNVCYNSDDDDGVFSIFVPNNLSSSDHFNLNITLLFPDSHSPKILNKLSTSMPLFSQHLRDVSSAVHLKKLSLQGARSPIHVDHVTADRVEIKSSSASIRGSFNVSQSLDLDTVSGPIDANVTLYYNGKKRPQPVVMTMDTGNSDIKADIVLHSPSSSYSASYLSDLKTFSGSIDAKFTHHKSTPPAALHVRMENSNAHANLTLDSKYQGTFDVQSKLSEAYVHEDKNKNAVADPTGAKRPRDYVYSRTLVDHVRGWVGWGPPPTDTQYKELALGTVEMLSGLSSASLTFIDAIV